MAAARWNRASAERERGDEGPPVREASGRDDRNPHRVTNRGDQDQRRDGAPMTGALVAHDLNGVAALALRRSCVAFGRHGRDGCPAMLVRGRDKPVALPH